MNSKRPKINVPLTPFDLWSDRIMFLLFFLIWLYVLLYYNSIPNNIPLHFNANGQVDRFGDRQSLWLLMGIMSVLFIGIHYLGKYPHLHNYTVKITEKNALKNYRFSMRILRVVNFSNILIFAYILNKIIHYNKEKSTPVDEVFIPLVTVGSTLFVITILGYSYILNKKT